MTESEIENFLQGFRSAFVTRIRPLHEALNGVGAELPMSDEAILETAAPITREIERILREQS